MAMDVETIARGLTKAATRALMRIGRDWTDEGSPGPARVDAYSLGWGKSAKFRLAENKVIGAGQFYTVWAWRLTPLGLAVRAHLATPQTDAKD